MKDIHRWDKDMLSSIRRPQYEQFLRGIPADCESSGGKTTGELKSSGGNTTGELKTSGGISTGGLTICRNAA